LKVEIWSDVVCPWCYIGKRRFEGALSRFEHADQVEVEWKSYELNPTAGPHREGRTLAEGLAKKYGVSLAQAQAMNDRVTAAAAELGLEYRLDIAQPGNTFDAHRLSHLAKERGLGIEMEEKLFSAYFLEGRAIGKAETLVEIAVEAGLPKADAEAVLASDQYATNVRADEQESAQLGIQGVPFYVINRKYGVSGAQPEDLFLQALSQAWSEHKPQIKVMTSQDGAVCTDDTCEV
jgi:predicted DsbA family dithiol-disulfide isomerase